MNYYYYLLLYCSSAGKGLTRDSALSGLPASNNLVPTNMQCCGARPSVDFATHGFAEVAARVRAINGTSYITFLSK